MAAATINGTGTFPEAGRSIVAAATVIFTPVKPLYCINIIAAPAISPAATADMTLIEILIPLIRRTLFQIG